MQERPVIGSSGAVPTVDQRSQRRRFFRFLIFVGIFAILATRVLRGPEPFAPPSSGPPLSAAVEDKLARAPRLSLVVLPFANLSGDPEQEYIADGLTDDLTTDLSHLPDSFVIAHSTALTYKGKAVEAKQLRKLGVRYALEGSVRRVGETIAVNAQLISTESGALCGPTGSRANATDSTHCRPSSSRASPPLSASSRPRQGGPNGRRSRHGACGGLKRLKS